MFLSQYCAFRDILNALSVGIWYSIHWTVRPKVVKKYLFRMVPGILNSSKNEKCYHSSHYYHPQTKHASIRILITMYMFIICLLLICVSKKGGEQHPPQMKLVWDVFHIIFPLDLSPHSVRRHQSPIDRWWMSRTLDLEWFHTLCNTFCVCSIELRPMHIFNKYRRMLPWKNEATALTWMFTRLSAWEDALWCKFTVALP
jgi:hypothetical protein